jgi:hypothetical protein
MCRSPREPDPLACGALSRAGDLLLSLAGLAALSGRGHCTDLGTRPGNYSFTLTGTAQGRQVESQRIALTVTIP